jgi:CheY-like chemotaxis protein
VTAAGARPILLLEDDANARGALRTLFEAVGHRVVEAGTVAEAVARAMADPPAVMLLDLTLPDGEGLDVLAALREGGHPTGIAVALTGHDDPATADRCLAAGCEAVLVKPVPIRDLVARLADWTA